MKYILPVIAMLLTGACAQKNVVQQQEKIPALDYQRCLDAEKMGGAEGIAKECGALRQEIEQNHN
ncbi:ChiQ/YbfN family lipoprotein [Erwinia tracheiphila]|uniref:Lipoprotein n=1 Tax=Erwinia tracheiphila TaxID=65700 RepID=A0A0M2KLC1_9GAMM|nr:ChiQ/YbfN family lipoprotein [Erwinia tracheiphila]AXF75236.1 hypothetical protein AV903_02540 [Erwinia tracheiphila]EOS93995.1 hypothetical protein ETR_16146 [Erwinia tracheiphila PSU-1]KKF38112.1 hypothetical protein SY86_00930 [Erwinia tracheiphila]UIA82217.1 ChiQ/YbfN family lipoprotein [Erwinia tracheiphila]UIA89507.1 ChiQ/YbfN family lipoprotein [Erwinia tracheiphila]